MAIEYICKKIKFNTDDISAVNYYSTTERTVFYTLDLYDYIIKNELGEVELIGDSKDTNDNYLFETSDVNIKVTNIKEVPSGVSAEVKSNKTLSDFFELYSADFRYKFLLEIWKDNTRIYSGFISGEFLKLNNARQAIIDVQIFGKEKELKDFYSGETMLSLAGGNPFTFMGHQGYILPNFTLNSLIETLNTKVFNSAYIDGVQTYGLSEHYIAANPYWYATESRFTENTINIRSGYDLYKDAGFSRWDFFSGLMLSRGWICFFDDNTLIVKNRFDVTRFPEKTIDANSAMLTVGVENEFSQYDSIMIDDGEFWSDGTILSPGYTIGLSGGEVYVGGTRKVIYSPRKLQSLNTQPFRKLFVFAANSTAYELNYTQWKNQIYKDTANNNILTNEISTYPVEDPQNIIQRPYSYTDKAVLKITPIVTSRDYGAGFDITKRGERQGGIYYGYGNFRLTPGFNITGNSFGYTANPGNCIVTFDSTENKFSTYQDYIQTRTFANNFKPLINTQSKLILKIKVNELITSPLYTIKLTNFRYNDKVTERTFSIQRLKYNLKTNQTLLTLCSYD